MIRVLSSVLLLALLLVACGDDDGSQTFDAGPAGGGGASGKAGAGGTGANGGSSGKTGASGASGKAAAGGSAAGSGGESGSGLAGSGGQSGAAGSNATTQDITIKFKAVVGDQAFACNKNYDHQGSTDATVTPNDFRFLIQDIQLIDAAGKLVPVAMATRSPWQTKDVALLDFEDGSGACSNGNSNMNDEITGTVPVGNYTGIAFTNGVPDPLNHADPSSAPPPLQAGELTWGWLYGYKFIKAELGLTDASGSDAGTPGGLFHLGSTGCDNSALDDGGVDFTQGPTVACTNANRNLIKLTGYEVGKSVIVADIGAIFKQTDLKAVSQCHSEGTVCGPMFESVGLSFADSSRLTSQSLYHLE